MTASLRKQFQLSHEAMDLGEFARLRAHEMESAAKEARIIGAAIIAHGYSMSSLSFARSQLRQQALKAIAAASRIIAEIDGEEE